MHQLVSSISPIIVGNFIPFFMCGHRGQVKRGWFKLGHVTSQSQG